MFQIKLNKGRAMTYTSLSHREFHKLVGYVAYQLLATAGATILVTIMTSSLLTHLCLVWNICIVKKKPNMYVSQIPLFSYRFMGRLLK